MNALRTILDHKGQIVEIGTGKLTLLVPFALEKEAVIITNSEKKSGTANNDLNWYEGKVDVIAVPWIGSAVSSVGSLSAGSDTAWYLLSLNEHGLIFQDREQPNFDNDDDFDTKQSKFSILQRFGTGWNYWWGAWGSKGDSNAYSS